MRLNSFLNFAIVHAALTVLLALVLWDTAGSSLHIIEEVWFLPWTVLQRLGVSALLGGMDGPGSIIGNSLATAALYSLVRGILSWRRSEPNPAV